SCPLPRREPSTRRPAASPASSRNQRSTRLQRPWLESTPRPPSATYRRPRTRGCPRGGAGPCWRPCGRVRSVRVASPTPLWICLCGEFGFVIHVVAGYTVEGCMVEGPPQAFHGGDHALSCAHHGRARDN